MTTTRGDLLRLLADLSEAAPDLRLGQMVANLATLALRGRRRKQSGTPRTRN